MNTFIESPVSTYRVEITFDYSVCANGQYKITTHVSSAFGAMDFHLVDNNQHAIQCINQLIKKEAAKEEIELVYYNNFFPQMEIPVMQWLEEQKESFLNNK